MTNNELILELFKRGLTTSSETNKIILSQIESGKFDSNNIRVILTKGEPTEKQQCRDCNELHDSTEYSYYQARVDKNGFLLRSNALCHSCAKKSNKARKDVLDNANIPDKPKSGTECPNCKRKWNGNWHRHHEGDEFIGWLCGHCNMSFSDQRTPVNLIKE